MDKRIECSLNGNPCFVEFQPFSIVNPQLINTDLPSEAPCLKILVNDNYGQSYVCISIEDENKLYEYLHQRRILRGD